MGAGLPGRRKDSGFALNGERNSGSPNTLWEPVFRGTRVPFQTLLDYLEGGQTLAEFLDDFPSVTRQAALDALEQAKALLLSEL